MAIVGLKRKGIHSMNLVSKVLSLAVCSIVTSGTAFASASHSINSTEVVPLFDGRCDKEEWQDSTKIELAAETAVYLMHDEDSLYVCTKGKEQDFTVIDVYIEDGKSKVLHNLHASAQLGEFTYQGSSWSEADWWNNEKWSGFWVPYAGNEKTEEGTRTKFLKGSHRELRILKEKFAGEHWTMMFRVSGVYKDEQYGAKIYHPQEAKESEPSTWLTYSFSK